MSRLAYHLRKEKAGVLDRREEVTFVMFSIINSIISSHAQDQGFFHHFPPQSVHHYLSVYLAIHLYQYISSNRNNT